MITLSKSGNTVTFTFDENSGYLQNGTIDVPVNSLSLILDESDMATFRKSASNDIFVSANVGDFGMSKSELEAWYKANMVGSTGGGVDSGTVQTMIDEAVSVKQDTLVEGRAIDITNNTVSLDLPISAGTGFNSIQEGNNTTASGHFSHVEGDSSLASGNTSHAEGHSTSALTEASHAEGQGTIASGNTSHAEGSFTKAYGGSSHAEGWGTTASGNYSHAEGRFTSALTEASHAEGQYTKTANKYEHASGRYNNSVSASTTFGDSGNTLFSVGNGISEGTRHNAFEIRQNGDIYLTLDGQDVKLQDNLGGGGGGVTPTEVQEMIDNSISGKVDTSAFTTYSAATDARIAEDEEVTAAGLNAVNDKFDGLKLKKLTQAEYDALTTKDSNTLYIVI